MENIDVKNMDILSLHNKLLKKFDEYKKNLQTYIKKYEKLKKLVDNNLSNNTRITLNKQIQQLHELIDDIQYEKSKNYFLKNFDYIKTFKGNMNEIAIIKKK